jgi:hypothetical protein
MRRPEKLDPPDRTASGKDKRHHFTRHRELPARTWSMPEGAARFDPSLETAAQILLHRRGSTSPE